MSELPKIARARLRAESVDGHPDADVLTAFFEQALPEKERQPVLAHLATCADCRLMMALALPPATELAQERAVSAPATTWGWTGITRWASIGACVVVVGAAVMLFKPAPTVMRPSSDADVPMAQQDRPEAPPTSQRNAATMQNAPALTANERVGEQEKALKASPMVSRAQPSAVPKALPAANPKARMSVVPSAPRVGTAAEATMAAVNGVPAQAPTNSVAAQTAGGAVGGVTQHRMIEKKVVATPPVSAFLPGTIQTEASADQVSAQPESLAAADLKSPGRAKAAAAGAGMNRDAAAQNAVVLAPAFDKQSQTSPGGASAMLATVPARWMLKEGQLQRSFDGGTTWDAAPVVERAKFVALSVVGVDIWAGGAAGLLYHSSDNGFQWTPVKPTVNGVALSADIKTIEFSDSQHGTVTTADHQKWSTADGGSSWQVSP